MAILARRASDVRITEVDLSSSLNGASPATAAIVVVSKKGPLQNTFFSNADDFRAAFGDPDARVSFDVYAALDFFKGGNSLWAVRCAGAGYRYAAATAKMDSTLSTRIVGLPGGVGDPDNPDYESGLIAGETPLFQFTAKQGPGSYGNRIAVQIQSQNVVPPNGLSATTTTLDGNLLAGTYEYVVAAVGATGESLASAPLTVVIGGASTTNTTTIRWSPVNGAIGYRIYGRAAGTPLFLDQVGSASFEYTDYGTITPDADRPPITSSLNMAPASPNFTLFVYDLDVSSTRAVETYNCSLTEQTDETGLQMEITQRVNPFSRYISVDSNLPNLSTMPTLTNTTVVSLSGGDSGAAPLASDINAKWNGFTDKEMYVLDILINAGRTSVFVQHAMDALAQQRSDCVAHLDCPRTTNSAQDIVDFRNLTLNLNSSYSMLTCSDALQMDPITGKILYTPMSGLTAALQARVSRTTQPWFSIAGLNRGQLGVPDVRLKFDDGQATYLYQNNLSYPRRFTGKGTVLWEANTLLNKNSALQFTNIRVLCNIIKRASYDYLLYGLQEPGDDILRRQLVLALEDYLRTVQSGRGIRSFRVVCDDTNNPAALVNSGVLAIAVIIVPILAVREIQMTLVISKEGLEVTEEIISAL
jgi:hypothetical protein